jgi:hypothetical protein
VLPIVALVGGLPSHAPSGGLVYGRSFGGKLQGVPRDNRRAISKVPHGERLLETVQKGVQAKAPELWERHRRNGACGKKK